MTTSFSDSFKGKFSKLFPKKMLLEIMMEFICAFVIFYGVYLMILNFSLSEIDGKFLSIIMPCCAASWVILGLWVFIHYSGAQFNPALTVCFILFHDMPWQKGLSYIVVQLLGSSLAALLAPLSYMYIDSNGQYTPYHRIAYLEKLLITPRSHPMFSIFAMEFLVSSMLLYFVFAILADPKSITASHSPVLKFLRISKPRSKEGDSEAPLQVLSTPSASSELERKLDQILEEQKKIQLMGKLFVLWFLVAGLMWIGGFLSHGVFNPARILGPGMRMIHIFYILFIFW